MEFQSRCDVTRRMEPRRRKLVFTVAGVVCLLGVAAYIQLSSPKESERYRVHFVWNGKKMTQFHMSRMEDGANVTESKLLNLGRQVAERIATTHTENSNATFEQTFLVSLSGSEKPEEVRAFMLVHSTASAHPL
jgi:hypothetical protein